MVKNSKIGIKWRNTMANYLSNITRYQPQ